MSTAKAILKTKASREVRKFSFGVALLNILPILLILIFLLFMAMRKNILTLTEALVMMLTALTLAYFLIPRIANNVSKSIEVIALMKKKMQRL